MSQLYDRYSQFPVTFLYIAQKPAIVAGFFMVGLFGFEPKTSSMSTKRSNQLSYNPMSDECIIHDMREICKMLFAISCIWLDRCGISTLQLAILLWIAVLPNDDADPICFIYRIRSSPCRKMTGASFPQGRAYGGQDTDLLQIHLSGLPNASLHSSASWLYVGMCQKSELIIQANTPPYRILQERGIRIIVVWWDYLGSNRRPLRCERSALTN